MIVTILIIWTILGSLPAIAWCVYGDTAPIWKHVVALTVTGPLGWVFMLVGSSGLLAQWFAKWEPKRYE